MALVTLNSITCLYRLRNMKQMDEIINEYEEIPIR